MANNGRGRRSGGAGALALALLLALGAPLLVKDASSGAQGPAASAAQWVLQAPGGSWSIAIQVAPGAFGEWPPARIVAAAALGSLLVGLAFWALWRGAPRTRPALRPTGALAVAFASLACGFALVPLGVARQLAESGVGSGSSRSAVSAVLFPSALLFLPVAALVSPRPAAFLALVGGAGAAVASSPRWSLGDPVLAAAAVAGGLAAAGAGARVRHPAQLVTSGLLAGAAGAAAAAAAGIAASGQLPRDIASGLGGPLGLGLACGATQGVLLRVLLPFLERASSRLTAPSLDRYASPEFPLLERLRREAPGTFHHSQAVGEIAAAAAEAIGADAPLTRVGGFYHDVGKLRRPDAFGENTPETCHRKLPPTESAALILAHTRDGTTFAREYRLPAPIAAFIPEHHGTTVVEFFWKKAKEAHERGEGPSVREEEFRYPGPRPRSPETALVHLADSAEAASRALTTASVAEIRGVVDKIFRNKLNAFQFEECDLSTSDLGAVREVFVRELTVHRHQRPKYPGDTTRVDKAAVEAAKAEARPAASEGAPKAQ